MSDDVRRYGIAVLASAAAFGIVVSLSSILPFEPFLLFAIPVALTSRYAGRGPTVLTVVLSVMAIEATLLISTGQPRHTDAEVWLHAAVFATVAFAVDSASEALRRARHEAEGYAEHLKELNLELEQHMEEVQVLSEDLHQSNESLAAARDVAEDASRAREEMLAIVAHDLRNPLNLVTMTSKLLADAELSREKRGQLFAVMQRAAQRMNRLIEDLLEVVRQESGKMNLVVEEVSAVSILEQTAEMFQAAALEKGVSLGALWTPPDLIVAADNERIIQVMSNLVGNALKFIPSGGSVVLKCAREASDAVFAVMDSGPGIAPQDVARLFEKFWQRRHADNRGIGLGLAIARGIIDAHGGRIWAESVVGGGSTFYFTLAVVTQHGAGRSDTADLLRSMSAEPGTSSSHRHQFPDTRGLLA
jgi:signal transduction histidine kinase